VYLKKCRKECAGIFPKRPENFSIKLRRFSTLRHSKGRCCKVTCKQISSSEEHFVPFAGVVKEAFDGWNSLWRIREVPRARQISWKSEKGYGACLSKLNLKRNRTVGLNQQGSLDHSRNLISGFHELKGQNPCIKTREVAKGEIVRRSGPSI
jgi:hypothetical protein